MRRLVGVAVTCIVLFVAILAGYWGLLDAERVRGTEESVAAAALAPSDPVQAGPGSAASGLDTAPSQSQAAKVAEARRDGAPPPRSMLLPEADAGSQSASSGGKTGAAEIPSEPVGNAPPTFDVVRVEPDGSTILAGRAPAASKVRLLDGAAAIGSDIANANGEFVVVLDEKLGVGPHEIRIEAKRPDGLGVTSQETAIVSIPEKGRSGELLAMVERPGEPTRLISVPAAPQGIGDGLSRGEVVETNGRVLPRDGAATPALTDGLEPTASGAPALSGTATAAGQTDAPKPGIDIASAQVDPMTGDLPAKASARPLVLASSKLGVEAVEIEGDAIYVAGRAREGAKVRVYFDERFLAEDRHVAGGRFLVKAESPVPTGTHTVRADELGPSGAVVARVEVPFFKPEGRTMSALAAPSAAPPSALLLPVEKPIQGDAEMAGASATLSDSATTKASGEAGDSSGERSIDAADARTIALEAAPGTPPPALASGSDAALSDDIAATQQPELVAVDSRVIIRRGDTLWRISRDTYGQGARYTVIYLANGDQIRDPDRIYPGQVFRMPKDEEAPSPDLPRG